MEMINNIEHHLQRDILNRLCFSESSRFSDLKPKNLESNIFMYHLKQLIKGGLVAKNQTGSYILTPQGMSYADKISFSTKRPAVQPKISYYLYVTDKNGAQLLWRRKVQPSINKVGVPLGKMHYGETIELGTKRELFEKTGLKNVELMHRGTVNLKYVIQDVIISNILCLVFSGQVASASPKLVSGESGEVFWSNNIQENDLLPGVLFVNELITNNPNNHFFAEKSFDIE
jgi:hypothetical protein